jgi:hypothetical protein
VEKITERWDEGQEDDIIECHVQNHDVKTKSLDAENCYYQPGLKSETFIGVPSCGLIIAKICSPALKPMNPERYLRDG